MKCNYKKRMENQLAKESVQTSYTVKRLWELMTILTLHREFGFGKNRLKKFADSLRETCLEFSKEAVSSDIYDRKKREYTNLDTAIIHTLMELRRDGIDHREILGDDAELVITEEDGKQINLDELLDQIERRNSGGTTRRSE